MLKSESEYKILNNKKNLIVCFGGMAQQFAGIPPFEFLNYLSNVYTDVCDLVFYIDREQCWYHKGIRGISNNIDETISHIDDVVKNGNYEKVIFMGTSAGGYAAILFGSLCHRIDNVISFIPQTTLDNPIDTAYRDMKNIINGHTKYLLYGNLDARDKLHLISQCERLECFTNVEVVKIKGMNLKRLRDSGQIKKILDDILMYPNK